MPTFLEDLKLTPALAAGLNTLPLFLGGVGALVSGFIAAPLTRFFGSVRMARRVLCVTSFLCAGALLVISTKIHEPWIKMIAIGLASFCNDVVLPPAWGSCMDVGGRFAGTLSGAMNMTGNLGGVVFPIVTAAVLEHFSNNWDLVFYISACSYVIAAALWVKIDPVTPVQQPEELDHLGTSGMGAASAPSPA